MLDHDTSFPSFLPEAFGDAFGTLSGKFDRPEELLKANVKQLEELACCVFAYFSRDDVFYVNAAARALLKPAVPSFGPRPASAPPIFWLEDNETFLQADRLVLTRRRALPEARELVTFSWGKSWLDGAKFPILSASGVPIAILFAGREIVPSNQIRRVADHYQLTLQGTGYN